MNNLIITVTIIVGSLAVVASITLPIISTALAFKKKKAIEITKNYYVSNNTSKGLFERINKSNSSNSVAVAFLSLILTSNVLIHVLINKGERYCDKVQQKNYCDSLTPKVIKRINELEGKYE